MYARFSWPKILPALTAAQAEVSNDFVRHWHEVLPRRYGPIERFNHQYPARSVPDAPHFRTIEIGAGLGEHLEYEDLAWQDYHCIELRENMAIAIRQKFPSVTAVTADCQEHLPYPDNHFDRALGIHVFEHLPDLPRAVAELHRVLRPSGVLSIVIPCDPGFAYGLARKISAERIFRKRYRMPYDWFIRREHINSPAEIRRALAQHFDQVDDQYFPLRVPIVSANLCVGITLQAKT